MKIINNNENNENNIKIYDGFKFGIGFALANITISIILFIIIYIIINNTGIINNINNNNNKIKYPTYYN